jgi:hypothetical protein
MVIVPKKTINAQKNIKITLKKYKIIDYNYWHVF